MNVAWVWEHLKKIGYPHHVVSGKQADMVLCTPLFSGLLMSTSRAFLPFTMARHRTLVLSCSGGKLSPEYNPIMAASYWYYLHLYRFRSHAKFVLALDSSTTWNKTLMFKKLDSNMDDLHPTIPSIMHCYCGRCFIWIFILLNIIPNMGSISLKKGWVRNNRNVV